MCPRIIPLGVGGVGGRSEQDAQHRIVLRLLGLLGVAVLLLFLLLALVVILNHFVDRPLGRGGPGQPLALVPGGAGGGGFLWLLQPTLGEISRILGATSAWRRRTCPGCYRVAASGAPDGSARGRRRRRAGAQRWSRGLLSQPAPQAPHVGAEAEGEGKADREGPAQWGRRGAPGPDRGAQGARQEGPDRRKWLEGEGSIRTAGAPVRIAFGRHAASSLYRSRVT
ncbi:hypothetical protein H8959_019498 [Pygathrix nigripes]